MKISSKNRLSRNSFVTPRKRSQTWRKEKVSLQKRNHELKKKSSKAKTWSWQLEDDKHQFEIAAYQRADSDSQKLETRKMEHSEFTESVRKTMIQLQGEADVAACKCRQAVQIVGKQLFWANFEWCWSSLRADSPQHGWWGQLYVKAADSRNCAGEQRRNTAYRWHR